MYTPCEKCNNGFIFDDSERTTKKCSCLKTYQKNMKLTYLLERANIPIQISSNIDAPTILNYEIERDYVGSDENGNLPKIKKYIKDFETKYKSLNMFFYGSCSAQKSTLARVIGKEIIKKGLSVSYYLTDTLIKDLIDSEREDDLKKKMNEILKVDLLILDEFEESKITKFKSGYQVSFITSFLKRRIELERKATIFASNSTPDNIGSFFGEALQSLISREILDKSMEFTDNYEKKSKNFSVEDLWK